MILFEIIDLMLKKYVNLSSSKMKVLFFVLFCLLTMMRQLLAAEYQLLQDEKKQQYEVVKINELSELQLFLKRNRSDEYFYDFSTLAEHLKSCESLIFAMNAGMYHPDYEPVGLYIENGKLLKPLNTDINLSGNFFIQPNGVLAWNEQEAVLMTSKAFQKHQMDIQYATQSGPMLVIDGEINSHFIKDSSSLKIRNGVGLKDNTLYFVLSKQAVSFYDFASFFKTTLNVQQALYLDGSISNMRWRGRQSRMINRPFGPMLALIDRQRCSEN